MSTLGRATSSGFWRGVCRARRLAMRDGEEPSLCKSLNGGQNPGLCSRPEIRRCFHVSSFPSLQNRFNNTNSSSYYDDIEVDMDPEKMLKPGDPNTFQATIRKAMPVGYWVTMPSGREAFLPAQDLGFLGGLEKLRQLFQPGQEVTVRVVTRGSSGREVLSLKKPDPNKPDPPPKPLRKEFEGGRRPRSSSRCDGVVAQDWASKECRVRMPLPFLLELSTYDC
ncbi:hypothetical protein GOP47_0005640 [Adiantum capillus-veneris]|uniref:S1 motif domain-containing protein n=1 Tax=Adiantum capillus-veneris TaxID=13818 RepID=A0A9D4V5G1_ADICA|nr:hypothetical protein GOP47_0005640 [Adiantum capillus-veneris]